MKYLTSLMALLVLVVLLPLSPAPALAQEGGRWTPYAVDWVKVGDEFVLATAEAYTASLPENIQSGDGVVFEIGGYTFTYKLSGGKMQWTDAVGGETKSIGAVLSSVGTASGKSVTYTGAFTSTDVRYSAYSWGLKELFVLSALPANDGKIANSHLEYTGELTWGEGISVWVDGIEYPNKTFTTSSKIVFKDSTGRDIAWLPAPYAFDSSGSYYDAIYDVKVSAGKIQYGLRVPYSWLVTATFPVTIDPGWTTPTGHNDPDAGWNLETQAYDDDVATMAGSVNVVGWSSFLELTIGAIYVDKVRFYTLVDASRREVDVDIYYEGSWHHAYEGLDHASQVWYEVSLPYGTRTVTAARYRQYYGGLSSKIIYEFDFNSVAASSPAVTTMAATGIGTTSATLNGNVTDLVGGGNVTERGYDWGETVGYGESWTESGNWDVGTFSRGIVGLSPGTTYHFRAKAENTEGWGFGADLTFTTSAIAPTVSNLPATYVAATTARLNGTLDDDGGNTTEVNIHWGPVDGVTTPGNWANVENLGVTAEGTFYADISGLTVATPYFFRGNATNAQGSDWADSTFTFTTGSGVGTPDNFRGIPETDEAAIDLSWSRGANSTVTIIRYGLTDYPGNYTEGMHVTINTRGSFQHSGLEPGITYYYSAWGRSGTLYSAGYDTAIATTVSEEEIVSPTAGDLPSSWFFDVDHTRIEDFPLYGVFAIALDEYQIPRNTGFFVIIMFIITVIGLALYIGTKRTLGETGGGTYSLLVSVIVIVIAMAVMAGLRVVPGLYAVLYIIVAIGIGGVLRRV